MLNRLDRSTGNAMTVAQFEGGGGGEASVAWQLREEPKTVATAAAAGKPIVQINKRSKLVEDIRRVSSAIGPQPEPSKRGSSMFRKRKKKAA